MDMGIKGRVGIVTGAGKGIGNQVALMLANEGVNVIINDIDEELCIQAVSDLTIQTGSVIHYVVGDVSSEEVAKKLVEKATNEYGRLDILINNAGISPKPSFSDINKADFERIISVNLTSTFICSKAALEAMKSNGWGRIVNLSSFAGRYGGVNAAVHYASSKAGIIGLTMTLSRKFASDNITVNCVAPGRIDTYMTQALPEEKKLEALKRIPMNRFGTVEEVASVIVFLASERASYITGTCIDILGGYLG